MRKTKFFTRLIIGGIIITIITGCGPTSKDSPPITSIPPTNTSPPPPTKTPLPPTRTPFPPSCSQEDPAIIDIILAFEKYANSKDGEGTTELFTDDAVLEETFQGTYHLTLTGVEEILPFWQGYYGVSPSAEFRDIITCENSATFIWTELGVAANTLWPVVIEITDGKISYLDFYEDGTKESPSE